jgi:hypothetical protein
MTGKRRRWLESPDPCLRVGRDGRFRRETVDRWLDAGQLHVVISEPIFKGPPQ